MHAGLVGCAAGRLFDTCSGVTAWPMSPNFRSISAPTGLGLDIVWRCCNSCLRELRTHVSHHHFML